MTLNHALPPPERRAFGQSRRKQVRRQEHKRWSASDRQTDPIDALAASSVGRVASLLSIKWERMAASPFGFFRGAVSVMAADLAVLPHTGIFTQLCGDAHVRNLGAFEASDGRLVFDINDFDETIRGPFEWDIKRMATAIVLAGREAGVRRVARNAAIHQFVAQYRRSMRAFAAMPILELARHQIHRLPRVPAIAAILKNAQRSTPIKTLDKLTVPAHAAKKSGAPRPASGTWEGNRHFRNEPPVLHRVTGAEAQQVLA